MVQWYYMNWIATNIRFPEDQYIRLKIKAARERRSVADVIRESVGKAAIKKVTKSTTTKDFMKEIEKVAKENAKYTKGFDSVKALREIRYQD